MLLYRKERGEITVADFIFPINEPFIRAEKLIYGGIEYGTVYLESVATTHYIYSDRTRVDLINRFYFVRNAGVLTDTIKCTLVYIEIESGLQAAVDVTIPNTTERVLLFEDNTVGASYSSHMGIKGTHRFSVTFKVNNNTVTVSHNKETYTVPYPAEKIDIITATDFTDEENPTISHSGNTYPSDIVLPKDLKAIISFDGTSEDIVRDIEVSDTPYTFELTQAERELLRIKATTSAITPITFRLKTTKIGVTGEEVVYSDVIRNLTIVGCNPTINPIVKDIKPETLALTGDENTFVRYESMAEYAINATASKHAEIVNQSVTCGSKTVSGLPQGIIDDVESGLFVFKATDSRNLSVETPLQKNLIEYVKPTCYQKLSMEMAGEFDTRVVLKVNGNYFNGSFGAADNELKLEVRHTQNDGSMGDWVELTDGLIPVFNGNTYSLEVTISGFTYSQAYTFQCRATDKLNTVQSAQYTLRIYPVFDWGETDFNFNVPVNINAEELTMHGETVLRHNEEAKNTVLSANGGHIYFRPGGTSDTSGETIIYPNGNVEFGGVATFDNEVNLNGTVKIDGVDLNDLLTPEEEEEIPAPADYIVETGTEAMGTNGTWYWTKWNSGKAECYGKRNFGSMAITTKKVDDVYRSATQTQALPSGLFVAAPEFININTYPNGESNYLYTWIGMVSSTAASSTSTGGFCVMSCNSQTASSSYITFHVIGRWK